jgi:glutaredoxin
MSRPVLALAQSLILALLLVAPYPSTALAKSAQPQVDIYLTSWCPYCKKAIAYFQAKGIPVTLHDIEKNPADAKRFEQLHAQGVPLVIINGKHISGYSVDEYDQALGTK